MAQRGELVLTKRLEESRLERDTELKRQPQIRVARFERDDVRVDVRLFDADFAQQFRKLAAGLAAESAEDLRERSDQALGRRSRRVEVPGAQVPLLQDE